MLRKFLGLVFVTVTMTTASTLPGMNLTVSQRGLEYVASIAVDKLSARVRGQSLPDQHGSASTIVGDVDYDITGMQIEDFTTSVDVEVQHIEGVVANLPNVYLKVHGFWDYDYLFFSDSGDFDMTVTGAVISLRLTMGASRDGHLTVHTAECSSSVGDIDITIDGGASWFYDLFQDDIKNMMWRQIQTQLCQSARNGIDIEAAATLARMKMKVQVEEIPVFLDYRLVSPPTFGKRYIQFNNKGEFFFGSDQSEAPFQPEPITWSRGTDEMMTICAADYVINTLGYVLNKHSFLRYNITQQDVPEEVRGFLNTTCSSGPCIGDTIAQLGKRFPNSTVQVFVQSTSAPGLHTTPKDIHGILNGTMSFYVRQPNGSVTLGFSAQTVANVSFTVDISKNESDRVISKIDSLSLHMTLIKTAIGPISNSYLNSVFNVGVKLLVVPKLNEIGQKGLKLPSVDSLTMSQSRIYLYQGGACFAANVKYRQYPELRRANKWRGNEDGRPERKYRGVNDGY